MIYDKTHFLGVIATGNVEHGGDTAHLKHLILSPINFRRWSQVHCWMEHNIRTYWL